MIDPSPREQLEQLKWLRGGVLAVHALLKVADGMDQSDLQRFDWSALAYLTEQLESVCVEGALDLRIQELETATRRPQVK